MKKLGFGMMRLPLLDANDPKSVDKQTVCRMVDAFLKRGFTYFDTAYMYHGYESENVVKDVLTSRHPRESFQLASKLPCSYLKEEGEVPLYIRLCSYVLILKSVGILATTFGLKF